MRNEESIKFSILVPVYQVEKYIDACIQSVLNQTYANWELILVDDGTKDNSGIICDRYAEKYPHIHVYHKENGGQLHTRLYAIARATGDYYVFLDSDDMLKPQALQTISENLQKYHCDCLIYGYDRVRGNQIVRSSPKEITQTITDKRELYNKCLLGDYNAVWRKAVRASVFRFNEEESYAPYFYIRMGEDLLHSLEMLKNSESVTFIDDRLYRYRLNSESIMEASAYAEDDHVDFTLWQAVWNFMKKENILIEQDWKEYRGRCIWQMSSDACRICGSDISWNNKKRLLEEIRNSDFYAEVMEQPHGRKKMGLSGKIFFPMLAKKQDWLLILTAGFAWKHLRNARRKMLKILKK